MSKSDIAGLAALGLDVLPAERRSFTAGSAFGLDALLVLVVVALDTVLSSLSMASDGSWLLRGFRRRRLLEASAIDEDTDREDAGFRRFFRLLRDETLVTGSDS